MIIDGQQKGPYPREVLKMQGLTPETYVWREGMEGWAQARTMPELADLLVQESPFEPRPEQQSPQQPPQAQPYNQSYSQQPYNQQPYNQQPYGNNQYYGQPQSGYNNGYNNGYNYVPHTNWLPWAIVSTVLNCVCSCIGLIFSIIGIVQANKANNLYSMGLIQDAEAANSNAKIMTIISLVLAGIGLISGIWLLTSGIFSVITGMY